MARAPRTTFTPRPAQRGAGVSVFTPRSQIPEVALGVVPKAPPNQAPYKPGLAPAQVSARQINAGRAASALPQSPVDSRVVQIQSHLRQLGYNVAVDGVMGPVTRAAMAASANGTQPNAVHHPEHSQQQAAQQTARVEAVKHVKARRASTPFFPGQKPAGYVARPGGKMEPVYVASAPGPTGDVPTGWNAQQVAQAQKMNVENQGGLFPYVFKTGLAALVPTRSVNAIANGRTPSAGDVASDVFNGALWATPGTVAPALRTARVAVNALREEGVTANAVRTIREARGAIRTASEDAASYKRAEVAAKRAQALEGPVVSPVKDQLATALEAAPNISRKQAKAILNVNDVAARAVAQQLGTTPEHAYELLWKGAQFHDIEPTAAQLPGRTLNQLAREPEVTNLSQVPEGATVDSLPLQRASRNLTRTHKDAAPPHANTPRALNTLLTDLQQRALEAADFRRWYANSAAGIMAHVNGNVRAADQLAALIAVYSPRAEVYSKSTEWNNLDRAINAFDEYHETGQISPRWSISSHKEGEADWQTHRAQQIMQGNFEWDGLKTNRFYRNFLQHIDPEKYTQLFGEEKFGTMDTWMRRAFGYPAHQATEERATLFGVEHVPVGKKQEPITPRMYSFMEKATQAIADSLGWAPEEAQAAIWTSIKAEAEGTPLSQAGFDFRDAFLHREAKRARPLREDQLQLDTASADKPLQSSVDAAIEASRAPDSGFTLTAGLNPDTGRTGYAVSYGAYEYREAAPLTRKGLIDFRNKHLALLRSDPSLRVGGWHNPDDGQVYLDISRVFDSKEEALQFGREQGQLAIFDRESFDVLPTGLDPGEADTIKSGLVEQGRLHEQGAAYDTLIDRAYEILSGKKVKGGLKPDARKDAEDALWDWAERNPDAPEAAMFRDLYHDAQVARAVDPELLFQDDAIVQAAAARAGTDVDRAKILDAHAGDDLADLPAGRRSNRDAQRIADAYMRDKGMAYTPPTKYATVDTDRAKRIAEWYDQAVSAPGDPEVRAAYEAMAQETLDQYKAITRDGYVFEFYPEGVDPYPSGPSAAIDDLRANKHLYVFPTDAGFGSEETRGTHAAMTILNRLDLPEAEDAVNHLLRGEDPGNIAAYLESVLYRYAEHEGVALDPNVIAGVDQAIEELGGGIMSSLVKHVSKGPEHPLLADSGVQWGGKPTTHNDIFRAVHDFMGHFKEGVGFRADGEENAWRAHSAMYSPEARRAMTAETRGQNSWVNYGPHGEANQTAKQGETVYADQKAVLAPDWVVHEGSGAPTVKGAVERTPGEGHFLHLFRGADVSTALHELGHAVEPLLGDTERGALRTAFEASGHANYDEFVARSLEGYFATGEAPTPELRKTFRTLGEGMAEVYGRAAEIPGASFAPGIQRTFDRFFQREAALDPEWAARVGASFFHQDETDSGYKILPRANGRVGVQRVGDPRSTTYFDDEQKAQRWIDDQTGRRDYLDSKSFLTDWLHQQESRDEFSARMHDEIGKAAQDRRGKIAGMGHLYGAGDLVISKAGRTFEILGRNEVKGETAYDVKQIGGDNPGAQYRLPESALELVPDTIPTGWFLQEEHQPRLSAFRDLSTQFPRSPSRVTARAQEAWDTASERLEKVASSLRDEHTNPIAREAGRALTPFTSRARVPKQAAKNMLHEIRRTKALRADQIRALHRVGRRHALLKPQEGSQLAHYYYAQLPASHRNADGLQLVLDAQRESRTYYETDAARELLDELESVQAERRALPRDAEASQVFEYLAEEGKLKAAIADVPEKIADLTANIAKLEKVVANPPEVEEHAIDAVRTLMADREAIMFEAGLDEEYAEGRRGLLAEHLGLTPDGTEAYVGHRMAPNQPGARFPRGASLGRTPRPQSMQRNELRLFLSGRLHQGLDTIIRDWSAAQSYVFHNIARGDLAAMGEPVLGHVKPDHLLINPKGHKVPRRLKLDRNAQAESEGYDLQDIEEYTRNYMAQLPDHQQQMIEQARAMGNLHELRQVPQDVAGKYFEKLLGKKLSLGTTGIRSRGALEAVGKTLDMVNNAVYMSLIYSNPGYIPANAVANLVMAGAHQGVFLPFNLVRSSDLLLNGPKPIRDLFKGEVGQGGTVALSSGGESFTSHAAHIIGGIPDNWPRVSAFLHEAAREGIIPKVGVNLRPKDYDALLDLLTNPEKKALLNDISDRAVQAMVDFNRMGPTEAAVAKRLLFVWAWIRGATRYPGRFALDHPLRTLIGTYVLAGAPGAPAEVQKKIEDVLPTFTHDMPPWLDHSIQWGNTEIQGHTYPTIFPTRAISPVSTPMELLQTIRGKPGAQTFAQLLNPALQAAWYTAQKQDPQGNDVPSYKEAVAKNVQRDVPNLGLAEDLIHPPKLADAGMYPGDTTRLGRAERALRVFPIAVDPEKALATREKMGLEGDTAAVHRKELEREAKAGGVGAVPEEILLALDHKTQLDHLVASNRGDRQKQLAEVVAYYAKTTGRHDFDPVVAAAKGNDELASQMISTIRTVLVGPGLAAYESAVKTAAEARKGH